MKDKRDGKFTVRVGETVPKTIHSRDSADRLVRTVVSLWRGSSGEQGKRPAILVLDFRDVEDLSDSAACSLAEFRREFSEDKNPEIEFSNMSASVSRTLAAAEKPSRDSSRKVKTSSRNRNGFLIKI